MARKKQKKVTVLLPVDLLQRALKASGEGITPTLRQGLELVAARDAQRKLLAMRGKFDLGIGDLRKFRKDRDE